MLYPDEIMSETCGSNDRELSKITPKLKAFVLQHITSSLKRKAVLMLDLTSDLVGDITSN